MTRLIVGPFNRVEGDLEVQLTVKAGKVAAAHVNAPLFRGFEQVLMGRAPLDALTITPRICGICSLSQSHAAASALADLTGVAVPENGRLAANLATAIENVADHITHFYTFFMPDFARPIYADRPWYDRALRFKAVEGAAQREVLPARARFLHGLGILAGKWPHTLALQPGGTTNAIDLGKRVRLLGILSDFRRFLEQVTFADDLEAVASLDGPEALAHWSSRGGGDLRLFLEIAEDLALSAMGRTQGPFLSYGAYADGSGGHAFKRGFRRMDALYGNPQSLDLSGLVEDTAESRMSGPPRHPRDGATHPNADAPGYTWCKAPRLSGETAEVGALARQLVDGQPLIVQEVIQAGGGNVRLRVLARLIEAARIMLLAQGCVEALAPKAAFCANNPTIADGEGVGLVEAARGSLGHWLRVEGGKIANYQIIAPTTWNFSPRDSAGIPGPCESALVGAPVRPGEDTPVAVQHIVRSFDPCMVCTVH